MCIYLIIIDLLLLLFCAYLFIVIQKLRCNGKDVEYKIESIRNILKIDFITGFRGYKYAKSNLINGLEDYLEIKWVWNKKEGYEKIKEV